MQGRRVEHSVTMNETEPPSLAEIHIAASHLRAVSVPVTPVLTSPVLNTSTGRNVYVKCENFQRTGSFRSRGALTAVLNALKIDPSIKGFVTYSSGNHGVALSYAASFVKRACVIVVPRDTQPHTTDAIESYGAEWVTCEPAPSGGLLTCSHISRERDLFIIPTSDNSDVIAGNYRSR